MLPMRGKILNVASASAERLRLNQELSNLVEALGCGTGKSFDERALRYEKIIVMTDADVDGAHIASLLITFFLREIPGLIATGHLYLAVPPLYRLTRGATINYARDDAQRDELLRTAFSGRGRSRPAASRAWAKCRRRNCAPRRWIRAPARCCALCCPKPRMPRIAKRPPSGWKR